MSVEVMEEEWLLSVEQFRSLLSWMRGYVRVNRAVYPFMVTVAEQALRPGEARALRGRDLVLPEGGWGELTARHRGVESASGPGGEPISILREAYMVEWLRMGISPFRVAELAGVPRSG